jgi:hypothetical protein
MFRALRGFKEFALKETDSIKHQRGCRIQIPRKWETLENIYGDGPGPQKCGSGALSQEGAS